MPTDGNPFFAGPTPSALVHLGRPVRNVSAHDDDTGGAARKGNRYVVATAPLVDPLDVLGWLPGDWKGEHYVPDDRPVGSPPPLDHKPRSCALPVEPERVEPPVKRKRKRKGGGVAMAAASSIAGDLADVKRETIARVGARKFARLPKDAQRRELAATVTA